MQISEWATKFNVVVRRYEERPDRPPGAVVYRLRDLFTTRDGSWEPSEKPGAVPTWARERYLRPWNAPDRFDDAGGDHHLFARVLDLNGQPIVEPELIQYWSDGFERLGEPGYQNYVRLTPKSGSGWANQVVFNHFNPDRGERGAWCWCPRGAADVVVGGGLPNNWHVSFFAVWQAEPLGEPGTTTTPTTPGSAEIDPEALRERVRGLLGVSAAASSPFLAYARANQLGAPLTSEFELAGVHGQGFAGGIVYATGGVTEAGGPALRHISW
ncbi:MAG TPA: hypothetical protein VNK95_15250 [Caldilineaceae bacterium]|nr:hypothetical protein [Caldilineaceae bacterium]